MADITASLFPEVGSLFNQQYLQSQQAGNNAAAMAQGGPAQAALTAGMSLAGFGGHMLGSGIGRALGGTTPEEQQAAKIKAMADRVTASGKNVQSVEGMTALAQELTSAGDYNSAGKAIAAANALKEKEATIGLKIAQTVKAGREQAAADPLQQLLRTGKYTPESVEEFGRTGKGLQLVDKQTALPEIAKLQQYKATLADPRAISEVDAIIKAAGEGKKSTTNVNVAMKDSTAVAGFIGDVQKNVKPYTEAIDRSDETLGLLDTAFKGNNPQAFGQALAGLSGIIQGGKVSNQDIQRAGGNPAIFETIKDYISGKLTGLPTKETGKNIYVTVGILKKIAEQKRNGVIEDQRRVAKAVGVPQDTLDSLFQEPSAGPKKATGKTKKTASGVSYTVED